MSLVKSNPKFPSLFTDLFDYDKFFGNDFMKGFEINLPAANVIEGEKSYKIELAIPGFKKEDIKVNIENEVLTISAETKGEKEDKNEKYTRKEFSYNSFTRSFQLPKTANSEKVDAKYENGLLKLEVAKKEEAIKQGRKEISIG